MTNIKVGDTVKTTIQGTVRLVDEARVNFYDVDKNVELWLFGDEVEKVAPPMPTAPGTVLSLIPKVNNRLYIKSGSYDNWSIVHQGNFKGHQPNDQVYELWAAGQLEVVLDSQS